MHLMCSLSHDDDSLVLLTTMHVIRRSVDCEAMANEKVPIANRF